MRKLLALGLLTILGAVAYAGYVDLPTVSGVVYGPATSTIGDIPTFSNATGSGLSDSGVSIATTPYTANSAVERDANGLIEDIAPQYVLTFYDDFLGYQAGANNGGFQGTATSGAQFCPAGGSTPIDNGHPGVCTLSTGTGSTGSGMIFAGDQWIWGSGAAILDMLVYQPTACDSSTNECVIWLGFGNSYSANSTDFTIGLWFKIDSTNNSGLIQICNGTGTTVCQNTTAAFSAATWTHFVITVNAGATLATFYTGSTGSLTSIGTVNNHIPTIVSTPSVLEARITKLAGTTARTLSLDYVKYVQQFTTAR